MTVYISQQDQKEVDRLRIALSQAAVDMTEVFTHDVNSHRKKAAVLQQLSEIGKTMDQLGLTHTVARKIDNVRTHKTTVEFFGVQV